MDGLFFEVKPKADEAQRSRSFVKPSHGLTPNHHSCPAFSRLTPSPPVCSGARERSSTWRGQMDEGEMRYKLTMIGFRTVHHQTTMAMLPWVVSEICRSVKKDPSVGSLHSATAEGLMDPTLCNKTVCLYVSASWVRCVSAMGESSLWDPLTHTVLFECRPHQVTKMIHNSQEPSVFACLVRGALKCSCYVFQCLDCTKVGTCDVVSSLTCQEIKLKLCDQRFTYTHGHGSHKLGARND